MSVAEARRDGERGIAEATKEAEIAKKERETAAVSGFRIRSKVNFTSALVTGSPLWNFALGRSLKDSVLPSPDTVQDSARSGTTPRSGPSAVSRL